MAPTVSAGKKKAPDHPIDLNAANEKELEELPGVGPTTAKAIIDFREKSGRFKRVEDLLVIRGISEAKLKKMRPYLVVGPEPKSPAPQPSAAAKSSPKPTTSAKRQQQKTAS
jgi:competence ComEA-like helix-hairpin-helix protein